MEGTQGDIVQAYAVLLKTLWGGQFTSVAPVDFRSTLVKHCPLFSGNQQHDSQELLATLLDKLHEDLNQGSKLSTRRRQSLGEHQCASF